jgi:hypothetical protein
MSLARFVMVAVVGGALVASCGGSSNSSPDGGVGEDGGAGHDASASGSGDGSSGGRHDGSSGGGGHDGSSGGGGHDGSSGGGGHDGSSGDGGHDGSSGDSGHDGSSGGSGHDGSPDGKVGFPDSGIVHPLGINLDGVNYYSTELPFLNVVKSGGSSSNLGGRTGWYTADTNTWDTGEEAYLRLDSDGYPTSLTASPVPAGGQQFTLVRTLVNYNMGTAAPGASSVYPPGSYRLKFIGQGTVVIGGDASLTLTNSSANTYVTGTFNVATPGTNSGITLEIQAISSSTDYPRDISIVQSSYASDYDGGQIFAPTFLATVAHFSSLRFMDWHNTNGELAPYSVNGTLAAGATGGTISSAWTLPSGSYPIIFIDGEQRSATFTLGSASFTWTGGLANAITSTTWGSQNAGANFYVAARTWANRSLPSNAFWSLDDGVPLEVQVALANRIGANGHFTVLLAYSDADIEAMGRLILSGTNIQTGYSPLASPLTASFEYSNEVWNSAFQQYAVAGFLGGQLWPTQPSGGGNYEWNRNYFGMRTAEMATDLQTAAGATLFDRVIPVLGAQAAGSYSATDALTTAYWSGGPASKAPIKAIAIAPYWGGNPSAADCTTMTAQADGGLDDFFATLQSQTGPSGKTYSSVPTGGWLPQAEGWIASYVSIMSQYPGMHLIAYEGGQNFYATTSGTCSGWPALVTSAERDPRMGAAYQSYLSYWASNVGGTAADINNLYSDVSGISQYGAWGLLESVMQTISPLSSAPPKYQAAVAYATGQ